MVGEILSTGAERRRTPWCKEKGEKSAEVMDTPYKLAKKNRYSLMVSYPGLGVVGCIIDLCIFSYGWVERGTPINSLWHLLNFR